MNLKKTKKQVPLFIVITFLMLVMVSAIPLVKFLNPPDSITTTSNSSVDFSVNIIESYLSNLTFNWNGTNYSAYNTEHSLQGMCNFDNQSSWGENQTDIYCWNQGAGYNITLNGGDPNPTTDGKYNGGIFLDGTGDYINQGNINSRFGIGNFSNNNSFTMGIWIKRDRAYDVGNDGIFDFGYNYNAHRGFRYAYEPGNVACYSRDGGCPSYSVNLAPDTWYHMVVVKNDSNMTSYLNGVYKSSSGATNVSGLPFGGSLLLGRTDGGNYFNGTMDDFFFYNKTLTPTEILGLYNAQVTKHSEENWSVNSVQSITTGKVLNSTQTSDYQFPYYSCATNLSGSENCSSIKTVTRTIEEGNVYSNFSALIGNVNSYFYGTNDQYNALGTGTGTNLDTNCDASADTDTNETWHRELFEASGMNHVRIWNYDLGRISTAEGVYDQAMIKDLMNVAAYMDSIGGAVTFVGYGTPTWAANTTTGLCNEINQYGYYAGTYASCPPVNHTKLAIVHSYIIGNLTQVIDEDKINFIPYNEPWYYRFFLDNLTASDNATQAVEFGKIYNASYDRVKADYPNVNVGWSLFTTLQTDIISDYMMANYTDRNDFTGMHPYDGTSYFKNLGWNLDDTINDWKADCVTFGLDCSQIIFDEWDITIKNSLPAANYSVEVAYFYYYLLNNIPAESQSLKFKWSARHSYGCNNAETEYPKRYAMVNEVDNTIDYDYNVTKKFATYCPAGSAVYTSTGTSSDLTSVSCKDGDTYNTIIINKGAEAINVSLEQFPTISNGRLKNIETDTYYNLSSNIELGIMDQYDILYLSSSVCGGAQVLADDGLTCEDVANLGCSSLTRTGFMIVMVFGSLIIISFASMFAYKSYKDGAINLGNLVVLFMTIMISLALWLASGQNLGAHCGVVG